MFEALRTAARWLLGATLLATGLAHLSIQREEFQAQVPGWFPADADLVVVISGVVEILLGLAILLLSRYKVLLGWVVAAFFVVIFPGNIAQFIEGKDAFGLDTDIERFLRLFFQPVLIAWALWSTDAWEPGLAWIRRRRGEHRPG